jgi:HIV Tat-specific factor 1
MTDQTPAEVWTFPTNPEDFDSDERISFSKLDNKFIAVQDDGTEYEFDTDLRRWVPILDEELIQQQQSGYMPSNAASESHHPQGKKRKNGHSTDSEVSCARIHRICSFPPRRYPSTILHLG